MRFLRSHAYHSSFWALNFDSCCWLFFDFTHFFIARGMYLRDHLVHFYFLSFVSAGPSELTSGPLSRPDAWIRLRQQKRILPLPASPFLLSGQRPTSLFPFPMKGTPLRACTYAWRHCRRERAKGGATRGNCAQRVLLSQQLHCLF